jgi:hypothetical protein
MSLLEEKFNNVISRIKETNRRGLDWIGSDGIISAESGAILTIFLMIFFPIAWAMILSLFVIMGKCFFDKKHGSQNECHDFICATIGVIIGAILGMSHAALVIF